MRLKKPTLILPLLRLSPFLVLLRLGVDSPLAVAQIVPDNTLGTERSVVTPNLNIRGIPSDRIDGGAIRGNHLFHSFQEFNIPEGQGAYFSNPVGIENILTRVTGNNVSNLLGTLGVLGNANLFLINPNGIVFGPNARLDVGGSFFATTADSVLFDQDLEFSASNPQTLPLLTINIPTGLRFRENSSSILQQSTLGLQVPPGETLGLMGGNVTFDGGKINSPDAQIELGGLLSAGDITLNAQGLIFPENGIKGDIILDNKAGVNVTGTGTGRITVNARNLTLDNQSALRAGLATGANATRNTPGDINIYATDLIAFVNQSTVSNLVNPAAVGNAGSINIESRQGSLEVRTDASVQSIVFKGDETTPAGQGNAGNITIALPQGSVILDRGFIITTVGQGVLGNSGNVQINAASLALRNGAQITSATSGGNTGQPSRAGDIRVNVGDRITIDGVNPNWVTNPTEPPESSGIYTPLNANGVGEGGDMDIKTGSLFLSNGGQLRAGTSGIGNSGNISVTALGPISITGNYNNGVNPVKISGIFSRVNSGGVGNSGMINLQATSLWLLNTGVIDSRVIGAGVESDRTPGQGNGGNVILNIAGPVILEGGFISTNIGGGSLGNSGSIEITAESVSLSQGSRLNSSTSGGSFLQPSQAGDITLQGQREIRLVGMANRDEESQTGIYSQVTAGGVGDGGKIILEANPGSVVVLDGAAIVTRVQKGDETVAAGQGNAGDVRIDAENGVFFDGNALILTTVGNGVLGNSGNIAIDANSVSLSNGSRFVSATSGGSFSQPSQAGNVRIQARQGVALTGVPNTSPDQQTGIFAEVNNGAVGNAGMIEIQVSQGSMILADFAGLATRVKAQSIDEGVVRPAGQGNGGDVIIQATDAVKVQNGTILTTVGDEVLGSRSGDIVIQARSLTLNNDSSLATATGGSPNAENQLSVAGDISLQVQEAISLNNSEINSAATPKATGTDGGNIVIQADGVTLNNGSRIAAGDGSLNPAEANSAGQILLVAPNIRLNQSALEADTQRDRNQTASIQLQTADIRLLDQSNITTNANNTDGGNITLNAETLVGLNNSDITANADGGGGGIIIVNADGVFGLQPLTRQEVEALLGEDQIRGNPRFSQQLLQDSSDLVAISTTDAALSGIVDLNTALDPSRGLVALPTEVIDPASLIAQNPCRRGRESEFTVTGRGGLPRNPNEPFQGDDVNVGLVEPIPSSQGSISSSAVSAPPKTLPELVPAQGWVLMENGAVRLVSYDPTGTGVQRQRSLTPQCQAGLLP